MECSKNAIGNSIGGVEKEFFNMGRGGGMYINTNSPFDCDITLHVPMLPSDNSTIKIQTLKKITYVYKCLLAFLTMFRNILNKPTS